MSKLIRALSVALTCAVCDWSSTAPAALPCPPDTDCSGEVDVDDLLGVINNWGDSGGGTSFDLDANGIVDVDDLLITINAWGPCLFDFGTKYADEEAEQIGLELLGSSGALVVPQAIFDRIVTDQSLIRKAFPDLADQVHSPSWVPNMMIVKLINNQPHDSYDCLNTYYQMTRSDVLFPSGNGVYYVLTFADSINVPALVPIYAALSEIEIAEPNGIVGGDNFWVPTPLANGNWRWEIDDGFLDCFDGCDCHQKYTIRTNPQGDVVLISYVEQGQSWCEFR